MKFANPFCVPPLTNIAPHCISHDHNRRRSMAIITFVLLLQAGLVSFTFPITELVTDKALFYSDAAFHWYQMKLAGSLALSGNMVGYDPFFNAGYPGGVTYNWSAKLPAALAVLLGPWMDEIKVYKVFAFVSAVLAPVCVPLAARWFRFSIGTTIFASGIGVLLWWASYFHWYHTAGMVSFVLGSYLALPYCARLFSAMRGASGLASVIFLGLFGAFATFLHPLFPIPIVVLVLVFAVIGWREMAWQRTIQILVVVPVLSLLPNLYWLYPMYHYHQVFSPGIAEVTPYQAVVNIGIVWNELLGVFRDDYHGAKIYAGLALAATWGCFDRASDKRRLVWALAVSGIALIFFAAVGAIIPGLGRLQPNRFAPVGYLMLALPASIGVTAMIGYAKSNTVVWWRSAAILSLLFVGLIGLFSVYEVRRELSYGDTGHYGKRPPEVDGLGDYSRWLVAWLKENTTDAGRVLFETSKGRIYDGARMAGFYAYSVDREFIGGPYPFMHFAGFWDGWLFDRPIAQIGAPRFRQYATLYNIGWVVVHSEESKRYFDAIPWAIRAAQFRKLTCYRLTGPLSFFLEGRGNVKARGHNQLRLSDISGSAVVLKYHYVPGLSSDVLTRITPVYYLDDPNPFIKLSNPPKDLTLYMPPFP